MTFVGGTRVARSPLYRTVTRSPWRACLSCLVLSGCRQWDTSTWGAWGTSDVPWVPRAWVSGKSCLLASLQVWLSRRQHLCSNLTAAVLFPVVLCVLMLSSLLLCSVAPPASLAGAYFSCTVGKVFKFYKKSSYHKIKYLSSLSHCSVILCCLLQSL